MEMKTGKKSLFLLCGPTQEDIRGYHTVVTFCPIRHHKLIEAGIANYLFGDFSPGDEKGACLDSLLINKLHDYLDKEAENNPGLKWAPLAIQQVLWPLSRYLWLKECLRNILQKFTPETVHLSSRGDEQAVSALKFLAAQEGIGASFGDEGLDLTTNILYRLAPYDLPARPDPLWFIKLRWLGIRLLKPDIHTFYQPYPNLGESLNLKTHLPLRNRAVDFIAAAGRVIKARLGIHKEKQLRRYSLFKDEEVLINENTAALYFSKDEARIISVSLKTFFDYYPVGLIDRLSSAFSIIFKIMKPRRIILMANLVTSSRLLAFLAHRHNISVDYLPHGILIEWYSGVNKKSAFSPDRILSWNNASALTYRNSGWETLNIRHPRYLFAPKPFKGLVKDWAKSKVLVFAPEWICVTQSGREDCFLNDIYKTSNGLIKLGVIPDNIHIKYHYSNNREARQAKEYGLYALKNELKMKFSVCESKADTLALIPAFDLVISGLNSGIYETMLLGVPLVVFGLSPARIGALKGSELPYADTETALYDILVHYNNEAVANEYLKIIASLQEGVSLSQV